MDTPAPQQSQSKPPNLLTAKQVAELLQWNPYTIIKKAEKGELPGFKLGREWRFKQEDIIQWIDEKKNGSGK
jgi:excisionase family DNA binding protein